MRSSFISNSFHYGRSVRSTYLVLLLLLGTSVGLNLLLARRVRQLGAMINGQPWQTQLQVGSVVPPIVGKELDGRRATVAYAGSDRLTILYIFTPHCGWCARNSDNFQALVKATSEANRFIGLSLSEVGLAEYVRTNKLTIPVLTQLSSETINAYKLGGTPQTLVISPEGRVLKNWQGAWTNKQKSDIEAYFHVNLPGIELTSAAH
jgi:peroxiredoxin